MIDRTFLILPGIGPKRERSLWKAGVETWSDYLAAPSIPGVTSATRSGHLGLLEAAQEAYDAQAWNRLGHLFPNREHWRLFGKTRARAAYLDIETTGTDPRSTITVVGVWDPAAGVTHSLIQGQDLDHDNLAALLSRFDIFVTFNGTGFDLPVLRNHFPHAIPDIPHLDLRGALSRLGFKGGLKRIEVALGLERPDEVRGVDGFEAVLLWRRYRMRGDQEALQRLVDYNREDVVNLEPLARFAYGALHNSVCGYWGGPLAPVSWPGAMPETLPRECVGVPGVDPELPLSAGEPTPLPRW